MLKIQNSAKEGTLIGKDLAASLSPVKDKVTASQLSPICQHSPSATNCKSAEDHATPVKDNLSSIQKGGAPFR
jgi:hypothetical protein